MLTKDVFSIAKRRARYSLLVLGVLCLFAAFLPMTTSPVRAASLTAARPGYVEGKVVTSDGRPIQGAVIYIRETDRPEGKIYEPQTKEDGTYSVQVVNGIYRVTAQVSVSYQGYSWRLPLHPDDNSDAEMDSTSGIVKNFTWKLHGLIQGMDPRFPESYYGATVQVFLPINPPPPEGKILTFRFRPVSPLVDGSAGGGLLFRGQTPLPNPGYLVDIPLDEYELTATQTTQSGQTIPLLLSPGHVYGGQGYTSLDIKFQPDPIVATNGIKRLSITALPSSD